MSRKKDAPETLLTCLADLFATISSQKKKTGVIGPKKFVQKLRKENELFRSFMHQDAHEFLNYLLNECIDHLRRESLRPEDDPSTPAQTWVQDIFEGVLTNETKCLCCETVTNKDEAFLDLSLDIEQNSSITSCLRKFSSTETLGSRDKFFCDACCSLQEAQKRMKVKRLPSILALHLKRFKFIESVGAFRKLSHRVVFPHELKLVNTCDETADPEREYRLFAVVVHVGSGINHGHYVSVVKMHNHWLMFDDDSVELIDESEVQACFGSTQDVQQSTDCGYILFYQSVPKQAPVA